MKKILLGFLLFTASCDSEPIAVDVLISGGSIHDGSGMNEYVGNVAIKNDTIFYVGKKKGILQLTKQLMLQAKWSLQDLSICSVGVTIL